MKTKRDHYQPNLHLLYKKLTLSHTPKNTYAAWNHEAGLSHYAVVVLWLGELGAGLGNAVEAKLLNESPRADYATYRMSNSLIPISRPVAARV